ncbi:MAG TPA: oligosaccharide flippase family protein [Anditalea sp.]|nr:oligosaccharide flippase family protein [Anditalea sp.]
MLNRITGKLKSKNFLSLAGNASMSVFSVITYALLFRVLSEEEMGNWVFFQFAVIFFETFRTGFLQSAIIVFFPGAGKSQEDKIAGSAWYLGLMITFAFALLNLLVYFGIQFYEINDPGLIILINWFGISLLASFPFNISTWISQASERFDHILYVRIINQGSFIVFVFSLFFFAEVTLLTVVYANLASFFLTSLVTMITGWARVDTIKNKTTEGIKTIFNYGKYSVGTVLSSNLLKSSDSFIIKAMLGPAALAIYNVPQRLMEIIEVPLRSFVATAMPRMSAFYNQGNKEKVTEIMKKNAGLLSLMLVPVAIVAFVLADYIVLIIGGEKYYGTEAGNLFRIFMVFGIFLPIDRFLGITLDMINRPKLNLIKVIIMLSVNVVGDIGGILLFENLYVVAWVSIFTFLAGIAFGYKALRQYLAFTLNDIVSHGYSELRLFINTKLKKEKV